MKSMRTVVGSFTALVLWSLALWSSAAFADKTYTLSVTPPSGASPVTMTATLQNTGNSTFNSLTLTVPANYSISGGLPAISANRGTVSFANNVITVTNIGLPVGSGSTERITITMTGVSTTGGSCSGNVGTWSSTARDGSQLNGSPFTQTNANPQTSISPTCFTVTYNGNGSDGGAVPASAQYTSGATVTVSGQGTMTRTSFLFNGWNTAQNGTGTHYATGAQFQISANVTLYAEWVPTYMVTYNANGGSGTVPTDTTAYTSGQMVTVKSPSGLSKTNSTFTAWNTLAGGNGSSYAPGVQFAITSNVTLYAQWMPNTLTVTGNPTSAAVGNQFQVTVAVSPGGAAVSADTSGCGSASAPLDGASTATTAIFDVTIPQGFKGTSCTIAFSATNYAGTSLSGLAVFQGVLACGDYDSSLGKNDFTFDPDLDKSYVVPGGSGWGLRRGPNRDGSNCVKVNYTCNLDGGQNIASCSFDKAAGQPATFKYVFVWSAVPSGADGWTLYQPQVSWKVGPGSWLNGDPTALPSQYSWVPALACLNDMFPTLPELPTDILPIIPNVSPYSDAANPYGASNPNGWYAPGQLSYVCIAQQGFTAVGTPTNTSNRPVMIQWWTKAIDESDILMKGP